MHVLSLGVGEAFDEDRSTNSHLVCSTTKLLLDCGYSIPPQLWRQNFSPDFIDAIFISHHHADHYFGIPAIFARMWEDGRSKPLKIICASEVERMTRNLMEAGYAGMSNQLPFRLEFVGATPEKTVSVNELTLRFAPTSHSVPNLAVSVKSGDKHICYSGDGVPSAAAEQMYCGADLLIHDTYRFEELPGGHAGIVPTIELCKRSQVKTLALTHISRSLRRDAQSLRERVAQIASPTLVRIAEPLDVFDV